MINIDKIEVSGFYGAILGMRNPFKNRDKSDSFEKNPNSNWGDEIGPNDLDLCQRLLRAGGDDDAKFMRMIHVQADVTAPLYWWKEFDTYKVATVANSESTMHTIAKREFTLDDFSHEHLYEDAWVHVNWDSQDYDGSAYECLYDTISVLNALRERYLKAVEEKDPMAKEVWYQMIQLLPTSYMQKRTVDLNYQTLRRIYFARRNHKLAEWSGFEGFCAWIHELPYAKELITYEPKQPIQVASGFSINRYRVYDEKSPLYLVDEEHGFNKEEELFRISKLITYMTINGGTSEELERVVKHSMVVIDAMKCHLDWRRSEKEFGIEELEQKYGKKVSNSFFTIWSNDDNL